MAHDFYYTACLGVPYALAHSEKIPQASTRRRPGTKRHSILILVVTILCLVNGAHQASCQVTLSPSTLAFGNVPVGDTTVALAATLMNSTASQITNIVPSLSGSNPTNFSALSTGTNACGASLAANSSCNVYVTFTPNSAAAFSATLSVADSAINSPQQIDLTGNGISFIASLGAPLAAQLVTVTIANAGTLNAIQMLTQGAPNADFTAASGGSCTTTIAYSVGQTCTVNVAFAPQYSGSRLGAILLTDSSGDVLGTTYLPGLGNGPQVVFSPGKQQTGILSHLASSGVYGVTVDGSGNIYFDESNNAAVFEVPWNGTAYGTPVALGSGWNEPTGLAVDGAGNLFVGDFGNARVVELPWNGSAFGAEVVVPTTGITAFPRQLAIDGNGNIYFANYTSPEAVELQRSGAGFQAPIPLPFSGADPPIGIAVDAAGNLYFADNAHSQVVQLPLTPSGFGAQVTVATGLPAPDSVAVDAAGNIYVVTSEVGFTSNPLNFSVLELPWNGSTWGTPVNLSLGNKPAAVAIDGLGNLYAADEAALQVYKLDRADAPTLSFATTAVGSVSSDSPKTVSVANIGNASLSLNTGTNPSYPTDFSENSSDTNLCAAGSVLLSAQSCDVSVDFKPTTSGALSENVVLTDDNLGASGITQSIPVTGNGTGGLIAQVINFTQPTSPQTYSSGLTVTLTAAGGASGKSVVFTIDGTSTGTGSITGNTLNVSTVGTFVIDANQAGNSSYSAAPQVQKTVIVSQAAQVINFTQPTSPQTYSSGLTVSLTATGGASGNAVVFSIDGSSTGTGSITGSTLNVATVGSFVIDVNQAGNTNYSAAPQVQRTLVVSQASQAISFTQPTTPVTYSSGLSVTLTATGGASGNAVVFTIDGTSTGTGSITGSTINVTTVGTFVIDANQAGNSDYSAAPQIQKTLVVSQAVQAINFTQPTTPVTYSSGLTVPLTATGGASGNAVVFTIDGTSTGTGSITGSTLTVTAAGTFVIDANQAGSTNYSAAPQVQKTIVVNPAVAADFGVSATPSTQSIAPGAAASFTVTVSATGGSFNSAVMLSVIGLPTGATASFSPAQVTPAASSATSTLTVQSPAVAFAEPHEGIPGWPLVTPVLALFLLPFRRCRRLWAGKLLVLSVCLVSLASAALLLGCNGGFSYTPQAQTYTLTVTGTSGSDVHSTTLQLTVQ